VSSTLGSLSIDIAALKNIKVVNGDTVSISIAAAVLSETTKAEIGDRPVFEIDFKVNNTKITSFGEGYPVTITIPYEAKPSEDINAIYAVYVKDDGTVEIVKASSYDPAAKAMTLKINHLSKYAVAYKPIVFSDLANHWSNPYVTFLASRSVIQGVGEDKFAPNTNVTRAQFMKMLTYAFDAVKLNGLTGQNFKDVAAGSVYEQPILWAVQNGITLGIAPDTFGVNQYITREQMAAFADRLSKALFINLPQVNAMETFKDTNLISDYAKEAVANLQMAGIISGKGNGKYDPKGTATRAEAATIIAKLVKCMIE
jgi:hypothetical protein